MKGRLFTIGYEGLSPEGYLARLHDAGVTVLCDVRRNPLSRKPGFSKGALSRRCAAEGLRYEHLPELGIASEQRKGLRTPEEFAHLFRTYERDWLPQQGAALERIETWLREGEAVALTCFEHDAAHCHRRRVTDALNARRPRRRKVVDL